MSLPDPIRVYRSPTSQRDSGASTSTPSLEFLPQTEQLATSAQLANSNASTLTNPAKAQDSTKASVSRSDRVIETVRSSLKPTSAPAPRSWLKVLKKWHGVVDKVSDGEFEMTLRDCNDSDRMPEIVTLSVEEVPPADRPLLVPGATLYWIIGYRDSLDGGRKRESEIRLRRLPYTKKHLQDAEEAARKVRLELGW